MNILRKWMLLLITAMTVAGTGINPTAAIAQATKPGAIATPAGKMAKKLPARDAKGRFVKSTAVAAKPAPKLPARDAKGRFVKAGAATPKPAKTLPPRDAKGRFMKKTAPPK